jgi:hypothetical protein
VRDLRARGLIEPPSAAEAEPALSAAGTGLRAALEETTDRLSLPAYGVLDDAELTRLAELARPWSRTLVKSGMLNTANAFGRTPPGSAKPGP